MFIALRGYQSHTEKNCERTSLLASQCNLQIYDTVHHFVIGHLPELLPGDDLDQLSISSFLGIESDKPLSYVNGVNFFRFMFRWAKHYERQRMEYFEEVLCSLDLFRIPQDVPSTVTHQHTLVQQSEKYQHELRGRGQRADAGRERMCLAGRCCCGCLVASYIAKMLSLTSRDILEALATDSVGRWSGREEATSIRISCWTSLLSAVECRGQCSVLALAQSLHTCW